MYNMDEGEVLFKEKYGPNSREIAYIKPPEQETVVILDDKQSINWIDWFIKIFLPRGYPNSVSGDYVDYQLWDTAQAFCSTITGILATQEVLRGVGVGDNTATPLAATITWIIKDGCGHMGKILFAFTHGSFLDAFSKKWRLYADTLNDVAMCLETALPLFKNYTTFVLCLSTTMKAIVGVAGGASRVAMTQHHAVRGNMADVIAKDSAQETAVNLLASMAAVAILTLFGNSIIIFLLMIVFHIVFNYLAVRAVCLKTLNEPRFLLVIDLYLKKELIPTPCEINRKEPVIFYDIGPNFLDLKICGFKIIIGQSMKNAVHCYSNVFSLRNIREVYERSNYILVPNIIKRKMYVFIKDGANGENFLRAYFHGVLLSIMTCVINDEPLEVYSSPNNGPFAQLCHSLRGVKWNREIANNNQSNSGFMYNPSIELMIYLDKIVQKEWNRIKNAIAFIGWDTNKHLLIVDEWRVSAKIIIEKPINETNSVAKVETKADLEKSILPYDEVSKKDIVNKVVKKQEVIVEPEITGYKKGSGKLKLEKEVEPLVVEPKSVQMSDEPNDIIEPFVSKADSSKQRKKKD